MKKQFLSLSAAVAVAFCAIFVQATAQNRGPKLEAAPLTTEYVAKLQSSLEMSDDQKTKVYDLFLAVAEENISKMRQPNNNQQRPEGNNNQQRPEGNNNQQRPENGQRPEGSGTPDFILGMVFAQEEAAETKTQTSMKSILSAGQYTKWEAIVKELKSAERPQRPQRQ